MIRLGPPAEGDCAAKPMRLNTARMADPEAGKSKDRADSSQLRYNPVARKSHRVLEQERTGEQQRHYKAVVAQSLFPLARP
jgi:hypothetical protein